MDGNKVAATDKITFEEVTLLKVKKLHEFVTCLTKGRRERYTAILSDLDEIIKLEKIKKILAD